MLRMGIIMKVQVMPNECIQLHTTHHVFVGFVVVLDLGVSFDSSEKDIKRAYRKLSLKYHPGRMEKTNLGSSINYESNLSTSLFKFQQILYIVVLMQSIVMINKMPCTILSLELDFFIACFAY